jgi:hypothetical protein
MAAGKAGPLSGLDLKRDQEARLHQRVKNPAQSPGRAQFVSLNFPNTLI